jgi:hypothetical protein
VTVPREQAGHEPRTPAPIPGQPLSRVQSGAHDDEQDGPRDLVPRRHNNHDPVWSADGGPLYYTTLPDRSLESLPVTEALGL